MSRYYRTLGRRGLLLGAGGATLALPFLDFFAPRRARASGPTPRRLIVLFHGQGTLLDEWVRPGASETDFELGAITAPLEAFRDRCLFLWGLDNHLEHVSAQSGHAMRTSALSGMPNAASFDDARELLPKGLQERVLTAPPAGPTIDQVVAERLFADHHPFVSVDLAADRSGELLAAGWRDPVRSEADPQRALDLYFGRSDLDPEAVARLRARRASVLDGVLESFRMLRGRVGREDRARLDAHADKLRRIERRVTFETSCEAPSIPDGWDADETAHADLQVDLLVSALACDLAPVGSLVFANGHAPFDTLELDGAPLVPSTYSGWHAMVHAAGRGDPEIDRRVAYGYRWYYERLARLLATLDATPEGGGTMLDHTLVLLTTELGNAAGHRVRKMPVVLAGSLGSTRGMGRCVAFPDDGGRSPVGRSSTHQAMVTVLRAMGFDDDTFGVVADEVAQGPLPGVL